MGFLMKVLQILTNHKFICSQVGRSGGYQLCRPPQEISLFQALRAMEGDMAMQGNIPGINIKMEKSRSVFEASYARIAKAQQVEFGQTLLSDFIELTAMPAKLCEMKPQPRQIA